MRGAVASVYGADVMRAGCARLDATSRLLIEQASAHAWIPMTLLTEVVDAWAAAARVEADVLTETCVRIGVRTSFGGTVALATATGQVAELVLRQPVRVWLIPRILPVRANNLRLSIRNPQKLVERFGAPPAERPQPAASSRKARTRGSRARQ